VIIRQQASSIPQLQSTSSPSLDRRGHTPTKVQFSTISNRLPTRANCDSAISTRQKGFPWTEQKNSPHEIMGETLGNTIALGAAEAFFFVLTSLYCCTTIYRIDEDTTSMSQGVLRAPVESQQAEGGFAGSHTLVSHEVVF
jgi:hypothetical protein